MTKDEGRLQYLRLIAVALLGGVPPHVIDACVMWGMYQTPGAPRPKLRMWWEW